MSMIGWLMPIEKPGNCCKRCVQLVDEVLLGLARRPGVVRA